MKVFAIFLIILCLAALGGIAYLHATSSLNAWSVSCLVSELKDDMSLYQELKTRLEQGTFIGTRFSSEPISAPEDYLVYQWTVRLENRTALPAQVAEIRVSPMRGYDILQFDPKVFTSGSVPEYQVESGKSAEITVCVLTSRAVLDGQDRPDMRDASLTWYLGGFPFPETNGKGGKLVLRP